jgi:ATP-dependent Clp protease, protease subunit
MRVSNIIPTEISTVEFRNEIQIIRVTDFTEEAAKTFSEEMRAAAASGQPVIPVIIDSYGGMCDSLLSMVSDIQHAEKPVATIAVGKAMSCGSILLSFGTRGYRYADPHTRLMIHEIVSGDHGKTADMKASTEELDRINDYIYNLMSANCGKRPDYFTKQMEKRKNADWYMTAQEALSHNIVDHLYVPKLTREIIVEYTFG